MNRAKKLIFINFIILPLLLFQAKSYVLGFEASPQNSISSVMKGETAEFTILFWNVVNSSIPIQLKARKVPDGISVFFVPDHFLLNYSKVIKFPAEKGRVYIYTREGLFMTTPVKVLAKVSNKMEEGNYSFYVDAIGGRPSSGISTVLVKSFKLTVRVTSFKPTTTIPQHEIIPNILQRITGKAITPSSTFPLLFTLLLISIFVLSWLIYKHV